LNDKTLNYVEQPEQLGTGHAVQCFAKAIDNRPEQILVVCGDTPLISRQTLLEMIEVHNTQKPAITMMTLEMQDPGNYGRIVRKNDEILAIREAKDCSEEELKIKEVNLAVYLFNGDFLFSNIFKLENKNNQKEFYLTDLIEMASSQGKKVISCKEIDESSTLGINSRQHLAQVTRILRDQINEKHMDLGVTIVDPKQTYIGSKVKIGPDTTIFPGTIINGKTEIGQNCIIGPHALLIDSKIGDGVSAEFCKIATAEVSPNKKIEAFTVISGTEAG
jgi:bifunctional UDP-N-acetylglucosamine pyrophosphorylase/glucosamine-1-phosphate N-acetyltransferase